MRTLKFFQHTKMRFISDDFSDTDSIYSELRCGSVLSFNSARNDGELKRPRNPPLIIRKSNFYYYNTKAKQAVVNQKNLYSIKADRLAGERNQKLESKDYRASDAIKASNPVDTLPERLAKRIY